MNLLVCFSTRLPVNRLEIVIPTSNLPTANPSKKNRRKESDKGMLSPACGSLKFVILENLSARPASHNALSPTQPDNPPSLRLLILPNERTKSESGETDGHVGRPKTLTPPFK